MPLKPVLLRHKCAVQRDICTAIKSCPRDAVRFVEDAAEPLGGRIVFEMAACDGCGICARECCGAAIEMQ